jgi:hypothetical protein
MAEPTTPGPQRSQRAVIGTLMPHLAEERHHIYRNVTALALLAALIAAGFGSLPVALVLTAVALPAAVLVYIHDHRLWRDEPLTVIVVAFGLSLLLGIGVGLLETYFIHPVTLLSPGFHLPSASRILQLGVLVPVVAFVAVLIAPLVVSARAAFRHPMDVVVAGSLSGAALSLGLAVVVQHGAFTHIQTTAGDPAHVAFIALTLGFLQPIVLATAATIGVLGLRRLGVGPFLGVAEGLLLVLAYELATTLFQPFGTRGIVLTALTAFVLAGVGLLLVRNGLHAALLADSGADASVAVREDVEHRLHTGLVTAVVAVIAVIAAAVSLAVAEGGPSTRPTPEQSGQLSPQAASAAGLFYPAPGRAGETRLGQVTLTSTTAPLAVGTSSSILLGSGVAVTPAPGWTIVKQGRQYVYLVNPGQDAEVYASEGSSNAPDITQESAFIINNFVQSSGLTNVQQTSGPVTSIQGKNFQQLLEVDYTADQQTNQGTAELWGAWVTLYNPATKSSGSLDLWAFSPAAFKGALRDAAAMMVSME